MDDKKLLAFTVLLLDEFLRAYRLHDTADQLKAELVVFQLGCPSPDVWFDGTAGVGRSCRGPSRVGGPMPSRPPAPPAPPISKSSSTFPSRKLFYNVEMATALSPVSVCAASPKQRAALGLGGAASSPAFTLMAAHNQIRSPVIRASQRLAVEHAAIAQRTVLTASQTQHPCRPALAPSGRLAPKRMGAVPRRPSARRRGAR